MKKNVFLFIGLLLTISSLFAQEPQFEWAVGYGSLDSDEGRSVAVDNNGNIYTTGNFKGTVDFDPGPGTYNLTSSGGGDIFLMKQNSAGTFVWAKSFGGNVFDTGKSLTIDATGNIYLAGIFQLIADFDPGPGTNNITSNGYFDVVVMKLSPSGNISWIKTVGGSYADYVYSIALDASGYLYITGAYGTTVDFDPGAGVANYTSNGAHDIFILKLDTSGNYVWAKSMGGTGYDVGSSITVDGGYVYAAGHFSNTVDFDPGTGISNRVSNGGYDIFYLKFNTNGNYIWAKSVGGSDDDYSRSMALSPDGFLYVYGDFQGTVDFNPDIGTYYLTSNGMNDVFVSKINDSGDLVWAKSVGGTSQEIGLAVTTDAWSNLYITGYFPYTVDFDPNSTVYNLTSNGGRDIFIDKLDEFGNFIWAGNIGGSSDDFPYDISLDNNNNLYLTGYFENTADLDPGTAVSNLVSLGNEDAFSMKLFQTINSTALSSDNAMTTTSNPTYYSVNHSYSTWGAVGIRTADPTTCNWSMRFYDSDDFQNEVIASTTTNYVDFIVFDQHHLSNTTKGAMMYRFSGSCNARTEFEGYNETLSLGSSTISWPAGDVVEIWDIYLTPGVYNFSMIYNSGNAYLDMALFSSQGGEYYQNRGQYLAHSENLFTDNENFTVAITASDYYGFVIWSNNDNSASVNLTIGNAISGLWDGDISTDWNTSGNWNDNTVPTSTTNVTIPSGTTYSPYVNTANAHANNILIESGATLTIGQNDLFVENNMTVYGTLAINNVNADLYCYGNISWDVGSSANITANGEIKAFGDWTFQSGSNAQFDNGKVWFFGSSDTYIRSYETDCYFNDVYSYKAGGAFIAISGLSYSDLKINGDLHIQSGSTFDSYSNERLILNGSLINNGGHLHCTNGSFEFAGNPTSDLTPNSGDYFNNLIVNVTNDLNLANTYCDTLVINNDLTIEAGILKSNSHTISIGGDWNNDAGISHFWESTGTVVFNGTSGHQYCHKENFYNVEKTSDGGLLDFYGPVNINNNFHCDGFVWTQDSSLYIDNLFFSSTGYLTATSNSTINIDDLDMGGLSSYGTLSSTGGEIYVADLTDDGLYGTFSVQDSAAVIDITQGTSGLEYVDLNGTINIAAGTMIVHGGTGGDSYWPYSYDASITMSGGVLDFTDVGIRINNSATFSLITDITGGVIKLRDDFKIYTPFNPAGGTLEFYGTGSSDLLVNAAGSSLYNLHINKSSGTVSCTSSTARISKNVLIDGGMLGASSDTLYVGGDWTNNVDTSAFLEGNGTVCFYGPNTGDITTNEAFYNLALNKSYSGYTGLELMDGKEITVGNDLHCIDGTFELNSNTVVDIDGDLLIEDGAGFNVNDNNTSVYLAGDFHDYNTSVTITQGYNADASNTLIFNNDEGPSGGFSSYQTFNCGSTVLQLGNVIIDNTGYVAFYDNVRLKGDLNVISGWWNCISGHDYYFEGDVTIVLGGWYSWANLSAVYFEGNGIQMLECHDPNFSNVVLNSSSSGGGVQLVVPLRLETDCDLIIDIGHFWINGQTLTLEGNVVINNGGELNLDDDSELQMGNSGHLNINSGGVLEAIGSENHEVSFNSPDADYWQFNCYSGGSISAEWASFEDIDNWGVYIWDGGIVDTNHPFDHCTFLPGEANGTLLWINNNQDLIIAYASFPSMGTSCQNVGKIISQGIVYMVNYSGSLSGESYENDPFSLIDWVPDLMVLGTTSDIDCNGWTNGEIDITVLAGSTPYSYLWSDGSTLADRTWLPAGTYSLTVTDAIGDTTSGTWIISEPPAMTISATISSCNYGASDGAISLTLAGGTPPYTYLWSNGATSEDVSGLVPGSYTVSVTDANACTIIDSYTIIISQTYVPDDNFEAYLETHDANGTLVPVGDPTSMGNGIANDDYVYTAKIDFIDSLEIDYLNISDLTGIEDFISLTFLNCNHNNISNLDLSSNTALATLSCIYNNLISLDLSSNTALTYLDCHYNNLSSLDLSSNTALTYLKCYNNSLSSLVLSNNVALTYLSCGNNNLSSLNLSSNTALTYLSCSNNNLSSLNLSSNTALTYLSCSNNNLSSLDLSNNVDLSAVLCYNNNLISLDLSNNPALFELLCYYNNLNSLDLSSNTALTHLYCYNNNLSSLDLSNNTALTYLDCDDNNLSSLDISSNTTLTHLYCHDNNLTSLNLANGNNSNMVEMWAYNNPSLSCIQVDDAANTPPAGQDWQIDATASYSNNCYYNETYVPDDNFEAYLETHNASGTLVPVGDPTSMGNGIANDDYVFTSAIQSVDSLDIDNLSISSLTGIEDFVALSYLRCYNNNLSSLDLSNNTALNELWCYNNNLSSIDLSNNTALTELKCHDNNLSSLDLSNNPFLINLWCYNNNLSSLDLSNNVNLSALLCSDNNLISLDLSNNTILLFLNCYNNNLSSLDLSNHPFLTNLSCYNNNLSSLDLSSNTALTHLYCNDNNLTSLNIANGNNTNVTTMWAYNNPSLSCIQVDDASNTPPAGQDWQTDATASYSNNCYYNETYVPDDNFEAYLETHDANGMSVPIGDPTSMGNGIANDDYVYTSNIDSIDSLGIEFREIFDLTGIEDFISLTFLNCNYNMLSNLDLSNNPALYFLDCGDNNLSNLDLSNNTAITELWCSGNNLDSLDVSSNTYLTDLYCGSNNIDSLDVSSNTALLFLNCQYNNLSNIDLSSNPALTVLTCTGNNLDSLDVSSNPALTNLSCSHNNLNSLDLSSNPALTYLYCDNNNLDSLDVSSNPALAALHCADNNLSNLDLSSNTALTHLYCDSNNLDSLDLSSNTALCFLDCNNNNLSSLDLTSNTALYWLYCHNNNLSSLDLSNNTALTYLHCYNNNLSTLDLGSNTSLIYLSCYNNNLTSLNLANGNNSNMTIMWAYNNPSLSCIQVDDAANTPPSGMDWQIDATASYSNNCNPVLITGITTNVSCNGLNDGAIDITVTGGTPGYTYLWSDGSTLGDRTGLSAGTYTITATDNYGATASESFTITQPDVYTVTDFIHTNVSCNGGNDGALSLWLTGGTPPDVFIWSNGSTDWQLSNLTAGTYSVTCTDANGCHAYGSYLISEPDAIVVSTVITDVTVAGGSDGAIDLTVTGGTAPYSYLWSNAATSEDISGLLAGSYDVSVIDANGCTETESYQITEPGVANDVQTLSLPANWSIFSTYIDPLVQSIDTVFTPIASEVLIIKNGNGNVYWPAFGVNMIGNMILGEGYQIKMNSAQTLDVTGVAAVPELASISCIAGWSIIGYLRQSDADISVMLASISSDLVLVKNGQGDVYWPGWGVNMIGNAVVGEGYQINMNAAGTLLYPANGSSSKVDIYIPETQYYSKPINTGNNMTLGIPNSSWETRPMIGDEIAVFTADGLLVGSEVYTGNNMAITIWGNDELSQETDGLNEGDYFMIKYANTSTATENVLEVQSWIEGDNTYSTNAISIAGIVKTDNDLSLNNNDYMLMQNMPNPFKETTDIEFYLPNTGEITLAVYNLLGEQIAVLANGVYEQGKHKITFKSTNLKQGSYLYKLQTKNYSATRSMVIIR